MWRNATVPSVQGLRAHWMVWPVENLSFAAPVKVQFDVCLSVDICNFLSHFQFFCHVSPPCCLSGDFLYSLSSTECSLALTNWYFPSERRGYFLPYCFPLTLTFKPICPRQSWSTWRKPTRARRQHAEVRQVQTQNLLAVRSQLAAASWIIIGISYKQPLCLPLFSTLQLI